MHLYCLSQSGLLPSLTTLHSKFNHILPLNWYVEQGGNQALRFTLTRLRLPSFTDWSVPRAYKLFPSRYQSPRHSFLRFSWAPVPFRRLFFSGPTPSPRLLLERELRERDVAHPRQTVPLSRATTHAETRHTCFCFCVQLVRSVYTARTRSCLTSTVFREAAGPNDSAASMYVLGLVLLYEPIGHQKRDRTLNPRRVSPIRRAVQF